MSIIKNLCTKLYEKKNLILIIIYLSYIFLLKIDDVAGTSLWLRMRDIWTAYTYISVLFSLVVLYNTLFKIMYRDTFIVQYFYYLCCNIIIGTYSLFIVDSLFDFFRDPLYVLSNLGGSNLDIDDLFLISVIFLFIIITTFKIISKAWKEKLYLGFLFLIVSCVLLTIISIVLTPIVGLLIPLMIIY